MIHREIFVALGDRNPVNSLFHTFANLLNTVVGRQTTNLLVPTSHCSPAVSLICRITNPINDAFSEENSELLFVQMRIQKGWLPVW